MEGYPKNQEQNNEPMFEFSPEEEKYQAGQDYAKDIIRKIEAGEMTREEGIEIFRQLVDEQNARREERKRQEEEKANAAAEEEKKGIFGRAEKFFGNRVVKRVLSSVSAIAAVATISYMARTAKVDASAIEEETSYSEGVDTGGNEEEGAPEGGGNGQADAEAEADSNTEAANDDFETMVNGVTYAKDAYSDARRDTGQNRRKWVNNFTNSFRNIEDDSELGETLKQAVTDDPIYLAAIFGKLPDNMKGDYAGNSDTLNATLMMGENGAEMQEFMLNAVNAAINDGTMESVVAQGGENVVIEFEKRLDGEGSTPASTELAFRNAVLEAGDKLFRLSLSDGTEMVFDDDCGNVVVLPPAAMETDGHVKLEDVPEEETPTPDPEPEPTSTPTPDPEPTPTPTPDPEPEPTSTPTPDPEPTPTPTPDPEPEPTPTPTPDPEPTPTPTPDPEPEPEPETIAPKDAENLERIDEQINEDIAEDIGTEKLIVTPTDDVRKEEGEPTDEPVEIEDGYGTEPEFEQNDPSKEAEDVDTEKGKEDGNDYSQDLGGEHDNEYKPVEEDHDAQAEADKEQTGITDDMTQDEKEKAAQETIDENREMTDEEFDDIMKDLGL